MGKRKFRLGQHLQKNEERVGRCLIVSVPRESVSVSVTPFLNISVPPTLTPALPLPPPLAFPISIPLAVTSECIVPSLECLHARSSTYPCKFMCKVLDVLDVAYVCSGNSDHQSLQQWHYNASTLHGLSGNKVAVMVLLDDSLFPEHPTIRRKQCEMLLPGDAAGHPSWGKGIETIPDALFVTNRFSAEVAEGCIFGLSKGLEISVEQRQELKKTEQNLLLLSCETRLGLEMTCMSFLELVPYLFSMPDVQSFLSQRLCQDPLERFFGLQRQRGGVHENPNAVEFAKNTQALRVMKSVGKSSSFGNCRRGLIEQASMDELCEPLPKRRRTSGKRSDLATSSHPTFSALQQSEFETTTLEMHAKVQKLKATSDVVMLSQATHIIRVCTLWKQFLDGIASENPAHFPKVYQYVGHFMFKEKVKSHYAIDAATSGNADDYGLTCSEMYALRYSAGYVPRTLRRKLEKCKKKK
ncbi:hypothetical protein EMCRGX_G009561 [Ephydatia muelleri]